MRMSVAFLTMSLLVAATVNATTIDVQLRNPSSGTTYAGIGAAPDAGTTWNQVLVTNGGVNAAPGPYTLSSLVNSTGGSTGGASFTVSNYQNAVNYGAGTNGNGSNDLLRSGVFALNDGEATTTSIGSFTISGLTGSSYNLYLYSYADGFSTDFTVNAVTQTVSGTGSTATASTIPGTDLGKSFVLYSSLSPVSGSISGTWQPNSINIGMFNGLQLVESVPEPNSIVTFCFGMLGLMRFVRRRRS